MAITILVTGATGNVGKEAVTALLAKNFAARAASRDPRKITARANLESAFMDYLDPASVEKSLSGVEGAVLIAPPLDADAPRKVVHFIEVAAAKPDFHVVFISAFGVDQNESAPLRVIERMIMKSGLRYTILRPNFFMENFVGGSMAHSIRTKGVIALAAENAKTAFIAACDIAAVAACAFANNLYNKEYNLSGPEALDHVRVAALISTAIGKQVSYRPLTPEQIEKGMRDAGVPDPIIQYLDMLYGAVRAGYMAAVTDDVSKVTGEPACSFDEFIRINAKLLQ
jgi:uncharacterized protein YbjT (DUF2867 family)